jgi:hypothetical protein
MALEHVEAVAIIRRLVEGPGDDPEAVLAARNWLADNHPQPEAYALAAKSLGKEPDEPAS